MTSQGTPHGRFSRAVANGNLRGAEMAARELGRLSLDDALRLCLLLAEHDPPRFDRAALRWLERYIAERGSVPQSLAFGFAAFLLLMQGSFQSWAMFSDS